MHSYIVLHVAFVQPTQKKASSNKCLTSSNKKLVETFWHEPRLECHSAPAKQGDPPILPAPRPVPVKTARVSSPKEATNT